MSIWDDLQSSDYGPWFDAAYSGQCSGCWDAIGEGDRIRADGAGGWLCEECGADE